jgi:hypothetical protein
LTVFFLLPTWFLVILGFLIVVCLPFWIIGGIVMGVRRREQEAISTRDRQSSLAREVRRIELLEEHRTLLNDVAKRKYALSAQQNREFEENLKRRTIDQGPSLAECFSKLAELERPEKLCHYADHLLITLGLFSLEGLPVWQCVWSRAVSRAGLDRDLRVVALNIEAYAGMADSEFETDVLALIRQLNNECILQLVKKRLSELEIVFAIKSRSAVYSLSTDQTIALKAAGVSDRVLAAMAAASALAENDSAMWRGIKTAPD